MSFVKNAAAGALLGGALLVPAGFGIANAQPVNAPDGLVDLAVGDVTILHGVSADTVATTAGALCGTAPQEVGALAQQVDSKGDSRTVCSGLPGGDLVITQNASSSTDEQPQAAEEPQGHAAATAPGHTAATAPSDGG